MNTPNSLVDVVVKWGIDNDHIITPEQASDLIAVLEAEQNKNASYVDLMQKALDMAKKKTELAK